ncbi:MAG TPA: TonB family protein [Polyangiaceae bacterium]|nr:TonB family protein [Polyangiaceae bacterium]
MLTGSVAAHGKDRRRPNMVVTTAWGLSLAAHCGLVLWGAVLVLDRPVPATPLRGALPATEEPIAVELLPLRSPPALALVADPKASAMSRPAPGGERMARPDSGTPGRGGDREVDAPAVNLAPRDDRAHLTRALRSRLERAQQARQRSGTERRSPEDDTVTEAPTILTFFADGEGAREQPQMHRRHAPRPATAGQWAAYRAEQAGAGAERGPREPLGDGPTRRPAGDEVAGSSDRAAPGPGATDGHPSYVAIHDFELARAQPMALQGRSSSRSDDRGDAIDDVNSEQEVRDRDRSLLAASTAGGETGVGRGGEAGPGRPGSGGLRGEGAASRALGDGRGPGSNVDPADARRRRYLRGLWGRVQSSWDVSSFPKWAALEGRGGSTIVSFVVQADGSVSNVVTVRPSGFPEFDARMRAAVRRAAPFGPPPTDLRAPFRHSHEFVVTNPAVRPKR